MPYTVTKKDGYQVRSPSGIKAHNTSFQKAQAQASLLRGVKHGWEPTGKPARKYKKKRKTTGGQARQMLGK